MPPKTITIFYVPALGLPPETYETEATGRAGYHIHTDAETGATIGYRLYVEKKTILIPKENVLRIEALL